MMFNKKGFVIFILLAVLTVSVFAYSDFHFMVGLGNDTWNFGLGENYDDQLSYSVHTNISYNRFLFSYNAGGYTNRGWKINDKFYNGRYDKFDFVFGYDFDYRFNDKLSIEFIPKAGASFIGDFGLDWYQNWVHKNSNINTVNLPYDYDENIIHFALNEDFNLVFDLFEFGNSNLQTMLFFNSKNVFEFESSEVAGFEFALQSTDYDYKSAYFYIGYGMGQSHSGNVTEKLYLDNIKGFTYGFGLNCGLISLDYSKFFDSGYGYSYISFDLAPLFSEKKFRNEDIWVSVGKCNFLDRSYVDNQIGYLFDNGLSLVVKNRYTNGFPNLNDSERGNILVRYKRNYSLNSMGFRYQVTGKTRRYLTAYSQLSLGISKWDFAYLYNMNESASVPEEGNKIKYLFFSDLEVGLNILPDNLLVCQNSIYQLNIFAGLVHIPAKKTVTGILIKDNSHNASYKFKGFAPYFGLSMHVGIDI